MQKNAPSDNRVAHIFTLEEILADRITSLTKIPPLEPVIKIAGCTIAIKGDISFVTGPPKSGKTSIAAFIIATAFMRELPPELDTLSIQTTYCGKKSIVYIDTEQPIQYTNNIILNVKKLLNIEQEPDNLYIINLRNYSKTEKLDRVRDIIEYFSDAHLIIVDGIADLVTDPNNAQESFEIINEFMVKSSLKNMAILLYLHENPTNQKMRGNLGSEAERKCGGAVRVRKDRTTGIYMLEPVMIRGAEDFESIYFRRSTELGRMVTLSSDEIKLCKEKIEEDSKQKLFKLAYQCTVGGVEHLDNKELLNRIRNYAYSGKRIEERAAYGWKKKLIDAGVITTDTEGKYCLIKTENHQMEAA